MPKTKYICKNCGKEYYSYHEKSNYCSRECRTQATTFIHKCEYCDKEIRLPRWKHEQYINGEIQHIYCSKECTDKAHTTKVTKICEHCGKEFQISNYFKDMQRFCSTDCYHEHIKKNTRICPVCGEEFVIIYHNQTYCSKECMKAGKGKIECTCDYCGKKFMRVTSWYYRNNKNYCCMDCRRKGEYWNEKDEELVKKYWGKMDFVELAQKLSQDHPAESIMRKGYNLGMGTDTAWTQPEIDIILNYYSELPLNKIQEMLPNRTTNAIISRARSLNVTSYFFSNQLYSEDEIKFLHDNYLQMSDEELAEKLHRTPIGVNHKLLSLELTRSTEIKKESYYTLVRFMRNRLYAWREAVLDEYNHTCFLTGEHENLVAHHIRSFNLIFEETIEALDFPEYDDFREYTDEQLLLFVETFLEIQESYNAHVCITESIHILFHRNYGYGDNTQEQWDDFVEKFKNHYFDDVA